MNFYSMRQVSVANEKFGPMIDVTPVTPPDERKAVAEHKFHFWKRIALHFVVMGNASGLVVSVAVVYFSAAVAPGGFASAFALFALGLFCAGITIFASWRHSATYIAEELDMGLLDAIPQRAGEWLARRSGGFALASFILFCSGILMTQVTLLIEL